MRLNQEENSKKNVNRPDFDLSPTSLMKVMQLKQKLLIRSNNKFYCLH